MARTSEHGEQNKERNEKGGQKKAEEKDKTSGKKRLGDEERIEALFYTYRPHSTEVAAARNYERVKDQGERGGREKTKEKSRRFAERESPWGERRAKKGVHVCALSLINAVFLPFRFLARLSFGDAFYVDIAGDEELQPSTRSSSHPSFSYPSSLFLSFACRTQSGEAAERAGRALCSSRFRLREVPNLQFA